MFYRASDFDRVSLTHAERDRTRIKKAKDWNRLEIFYKIHRVEAPKVHLSKLGHAFLAIDVERLIPLATFKSRVAATLAGMRAVDRRPGVDRIYAPGDIERNADDDRRSNGCPLTHDLIRDLGNLSEELNVPMPEPIDTER